MSTEGNKAIVRRLMEATTRLAEGGSDDGVLDQIASPEVARRYREEFAPWSISTFGPTHHVEITDMIAEGDKVWARLATSGDHVGEWMGIAPTHRKWTNTGAYFVRLENGKIVEVQGLFDVLGHLQQLGATIQPPKTDS